MTGGFNSEIEHSGVKFQVQTEDLGVDSIRTVIFVEGEVLLSRETPYEEIAEQETVGNKTGLLHQLACAAVRSGQIKMPLFDGMNEDSAAIDRDPSVKTVEKNVETESNPGCKIELIADYEFRQGKSCNVSVRLIDLFDNKLIEGVRVMLAIVRDNFRPRASYSFTDRFGIANFNVTLPHFTIGKGFILLRAETKNDCEDLRIPIHTD